MGTSSLYILQRQSIGDYGLHMHSPHQFYPWKRCTYNCFETAQLKVPSFTGQYGSTPPQVHLCTRLKQLYSSWWTLIDQAEWFLKKISSPESHTVPWSPNWPASRPLSGNTCRLTARFVYIMIYGQRCGGKFNSIREKPLKMRPR